MSRNTKLVVVIGVLMFSIISVVAMIVANIRYNAGYESGYALAYNTRYSEGYDKGLSVGNTSGYELGYGEGFSNGNQSGYNIGYNTGYDEGVFVGELSGYEQGYDNGYEQGLDDGAGHGYTVRDLTYEEALQFTQSDQTDKHSYDEETYTCVNFAADFKNNAFNTGYRCGFVYVDFVEGSHAIVCFNIIDERVIFIEPQDDNIVTLTIGEPYWDRSQYMVDYDDTVVRYMIVW